MHEKLFLPFTPAGKAIELRAIELKRTYGFGPYTAVDPDTLASAMKAHIVDEDWFASLAPALRQAVLVDHRDRWSAGSITVQGRLVVLANPGHSRTRRTVTLLEELVHHGLGHPKSQLIMRDGIVLRTCRHDVEDEAYAVATALVMPYRELFAHVNRGDPIDQLQTPAPVSQECRLFRVKRAGLWRLMQSRVRSA